MRRLLRIVEWIVVASIIGWGIGIVPIARVVIAQGWNFRVASDCAAQTGAITGAVCIQIGVPPTTWFYTGTAWAQFADTTGTTVTLNVVDEIASVAMAGQTTALLRIPPSQSLAGPSTLVPVRSADGGVTYVESDVYFFDGAGAPTQVLSFPIGVPTDPVTLQIYSPIGATHLGVKLKTYGSGSADATVRALHMQTRSALLGTDGTKPVPLPLTDFGSLRALNSFIVHAVSTYAYPRRVSTAIVNVNDNCAITAGAGQITGDMPSGLTGTFQAEARVGTGSWFSTPFLLTTSGIPVTAISSFPARGVFIETNWSEYRLRASVASAGSTTCSIEVSPGAGFVRSWNLPKTDGTNIEKLDPCETETQITKDVSQTASSVLFAAVSGKKNYICSGLLVAGAAEIINLVEGTGSVCGTSTAAIAGSTTVGNGMSFGANGGFIGIGGKGQMLVGKATNVDFCLTQSGSNRISGFITYVQRVP